MEINCINCTERLGYYLSDMPHQWRSQIVNLICDALETDCNKDCSDCQFKAYLSSFIYKNGIISIKYTNEINDTVTRNFDVSELISNSLADVDPKCITSPEEWASMSHVARLQAIINYDCECCPTTTSTTTTTTVQTTSSSTTSTTTLGICVNYLVTNTSDHDINIGWVDCETHEVKGIVLPSGQSTMICSVQGGISAPDGTVEPISDCTPAPTTIIYSSSSSSTTIQTTLPTTTESTSQTTTVATTETTITTETTLPVPTTESTTTTTTCLDCYSGYTATGQDCIKTLTEVATPAVNPQNSEAKTSTVYSSQGTLIYDPGFAHDGTGTSHQIPVSNPFWFNSGNTTDGPMNRTSLWTNPVYDGQKVGFTVCITAPETKTYYFGIGCDDSAEIIVDSVSILKQFSDIAFLPWNIYPVELSAGDHIIEVIGENYGVLAGIGFEVYNNTKAEIIAAGAYTDLNLIYSSKDHIGEPIQIGSGGYGWSCPEGYSLVLCDGPAYCKKVDHIGCGESPTTTSTTTSDPNCPTIGGVQGFEGTTTTTTTLGTPMLRTLTPGVSETDACSGISSVECGPLDVVFVIDDTNSMKNTLDSVKNNVAALGTLVSTKSNGDYRLALITFKDFVRKRLDFTINNIAAFTSAVNNLVNGGGADYPESSNLAIEGVVNETVVTFRPEATKIIIMVTDAWPGGYGTLNSYEQVDVDSVTTIANAAKDKDIKICTVLVSGYEVTQAPLPNLSTITKLWADITRGTFVWDQTEGKSFYDAIAFSIDNCGSIHNARQFYVNGDIEIANGTTLYQDIELSTPVEAGWYSLNGTDVYQTNSSGQVINLGPCASTTSTTTILYPPTTSTTTSTTFVATVVNWENTALNTPAYSWLTINNNSAGGNIVNSSVTDGEFNQESGTFTVSHFTSLAINSSWSGFPNVANDLVSIIRITDSTQPGQEEIRVKKWTTGGSTANTASVTAQHNHIHDIKVYVFEVAKKIYVEVTSTGVITLRLSDGTPVSTNRDMYLDINFTGSLGNSTQLLVRVPAGTSTMTWNPDPYFAEGETVVSTNFYDAYGNKDYYDFGSETDFAAYYGPYVP